MSNNQKLIHRTNRVIGQVNAIKDKLSEDSYDCAQMMTLLKAAKGALRGLENEIMKQNIVKCLDEDVSKKELKQNLENIIQLIK